MGIVVLVIVLFEWVRCVLVMWVVLCVIMFLSWLGVLVLIMILVWRKMFWLLVMKVFMFGLVIRYMFILVGCRFVVIRMGLVYLCSRCLIFVFWISDWFRVFMFDVVVRKYVMVMVLRIFILFLLYSFCWNILVVFF